MRVHLATTSAMSSASTSSLRNLLALLQLGQLARSAASISFSSEGRTPYFSSAALFRSPWRSAAA